MLTTTDDLYVSYILKYDMIISFDKDQIARFEKLYLLRTLEIHTPLIWIISRLLDKKNKN